MHRPVTNEMTVREMGGKLSIISILSLFNREKFCALYNWQRPVKPRCFTASMLSVDKDWAPERPARKSQSHAGQRVRVRKVIFP